MKKLLYILCIAAMFCACNPVGVPDNGKDDPDGDGEYSLPFAKGADISWASEMESLGLKFYDKSGKSMECTALMKSLGFNAVRFRVWVNPADGWSGREDVLKKALVAQKLGMKIMIDFHYSDNWADPGKQYVPAEWKDYDEKRMADAVAAHTKDVLKHLKDNGVDVAWVQVGNEVENGMLWESGRVSGQNGKTFASYFNAGASSVREVYPDAYVILHVSNSWKTETLTWFYDLMDNCGAEYDMIGLSLYPSYWENGVYPDWRTKTAAAVSNFSMLAERYSKPVMLVEFGMPASEPDKAADCLRYILDNTEDMESFKGIFYWEPESEHSRFSYDYGAFKEGMPTSALDPFAN